MARTSLHSLCVILAGALVFGAVGCVDNTGAHHNEPRENDQQGPPDDLDAESQLLFYGDLCEDEDLICTRGATVGTSLDLSVQLLNSSGDPIENAIISFDEELVQGAAGVELAGANVPTDANGVATTVLNIPDSLDALGTVEITAAVRDESEIHPLLFTIGISSKDAASYIIEFTNEGTSNPSRVRPLLLTPDWDCDDARDDFFDTRTWPSAEYMLPHAAVLPDGTINNAILNNVPNNESFTVIGVAEEQVGNQYIDVGFGCVDDAPAVEHGIDVRVEVPLNDHIPHFGYRYDMTHGFSLVDAFPPAVVQIIDLLSTLVNDPAVFILGCPATNSACPEGGQTGILDLLLDFVNLPANVEDAINTFRNSAIFQAALDTLSEFLVDQLPEWAQDTFVATDDIIQILEEFTVLGWMYFEEQAHRAFLGNEVVGLFNEPHENQGRQLWDELVFHWNLGCEEGDVGSECSRVTINTDDLGAGESDIVEGYFDATVHGANSISIQRHPLTLHYGALLIGVVEKIILPRIFGHDVDDLNSLIQYFFTCEELADELVGPDHSLHGTVETICDDALVQAQQALYNWIEEALVADGGNHFYVGTPEGRPCDIYQPTVYPQTSWIGSPLPYIERFGDEDEERCEWEVEINYSGGAEADIIIGGEFDGKLDSDPTAGQ